MRVHDVCACACVCVCVCVCVCHAQSLEEDRSQLQATHERLTNELSARTSALADKEKRIAALESAAQVSESVTKRLHDCKSLLFSVATLPCALQHLRAQHR